MLGNDCRVACLLYRRSSRRSASRGAGSAEPAGLKVEYQAADKTWHVLAPSAADPALFPLAGPILKETAVRATAVDRAGNSTMRVINLDMSLATAAVAKAGTPEPVPDVIE